jgi:hypothetical protein
MHPLQHPTTICYCPKYGERHTIPWIVKIHRNPAIALLNNSSAAGVRIAVVQVGHNAIATTPASRDHPLVVKTG